MTLLRLGKTLIARPRYLAIAFSVLLHILVVLFAGYQSKIRRVKKETKNEKKILAAVRLQAIPLAPLTAPAAVQIFKEDLFNDTKDEEKKLFKLRRTEDKRRTIKINQDDAFRHLTIPGSRSRGGSTNISYIEDHFLDIKPVPMNLRLHLPIPDRAAALGIRVFSIVVEIMIDATGLIVRSRLVTNGDFGFGKAALKALEGVRFKPGRLRGKAVPSLIRERFLFKK